jgi:hypothetical protein
MRICLRTYIPTAIFFSRKTKPQNGQKNLNGFDWFRQTIKKPILFHVNFFVRSHLGSAVLLTFLTQTSFHGAKPEARGRESGLPDGIVAYQKYQFWKAFE